MIIISKRKLIVFICFLVMTVSIISFFSHDKTSVFSESITKCIIIDAGHGFPDGGAVGKNGTVESELNLKVARLTKKELQKKGYSVIMTREDENAIASGNKIASLKRTDMHKRLDIINSSPADMFISIHMNKFSDSRYGGAQVIYSSNYEQSETLAACLQNKLHSLKENQQKRIILRAPNSIYLMKNAKIPAVIVECGFLSNDYDEKLLNTKKYQKKLAAAIASGIEDYYNNTEKELDK